MGLQTAISIRYSLPTLKQVFINRGNARRNNPILPPPVQNHSMDEIPLRRGTQAARRERMRSRARNPDAMYPNQNMEQYQREIQNFMVNRYRQAEIDRALKRIIERHRDDLLIAAANQQDDDEAKNPN